MMEAKMDAHHEEMMAIMKADRKDMKTGLGVTEACLLKPTPEEMEAVAEHQEVSK
jgi:hypothetical protein